MEAHRFQRNHKLHTWKPTIFYTLNPSHSPFPSSFILLFFLRSSSIVNTIHWKKRRRLHLCDYWFDCTSFKLNSTMASTQGILKPRKSTSKYANSPSSSTTSSSKHFPEASVDNLSSPASSSRSKPQYFYSESLPLGSERSKENVTVTVRFRPLRWSNRGINYGLVYLLRLIWM